MKRGRPAKSEIRQNIQDILLQIKKGYGYDIYKTYSAIFPKITMRSVYYHLKKGVQLGEFKVEKIQKEKGNYSWGTEVEKVYYALGKNNSAKENARVKNYLENKKKK